MKYKTWLILLLLLACFPVQGQQPRSNQWKDFEFLLGEWTWSGGGQPGQAKGTSTFEPDMNGTVLLRKVHLNYPASKDRAAFSHDDLLYVYHDPADNSLRAIFFDSENHAIRYAISFPAGGDSIQFLSDAAPSGTRARMTYTRSGADSVTEKFELAPPGKPDQFATYVEFVAKRIGK